MKLTSTLFFTLLSLASLFAQPANDDCPGVVHLGVAPVCPSPVIYTNVNATESNIGMDNFPPCFIGNPQRDVWFSFVATAAFLDYAITLTGVSDGVSGPIEQPQIAFYRGDCLVDELVLLDCASAAAGETEVGMDVDGLTPGITYFLRINDWSASAAPNWGAFQLCIKENIQTEYQIDELFSDHCAGELYDTGGEAGNYGDNEDHAFTICPNDPHECIVFNMLEYNTEEGWDFISFHDGGNINDPLIATIAGGANGANMGGVCYPIVATSGCLTVHFTADAIINFEGFHGEWHCTGDCPEPEPMTLQIDPQDADIESFTENPLMDITVTGVNCPDGALGVFQNADNTSLGMDKGLLLTTGSAAEVNNPASFFANNDLDLGGDPELDFLNQQYGNGQNTSDACIVEMDVLVKTDRIAFDYVFGSDEYKNTFSGQSNDLIGVLLSGPGIPGEPGLNNQENLAFLPGTNNTLIQIQTVNASQNWQFYRNNLNSETIAYNGLTSGYLGSSKTLLAARTVTPCQTYHVKIAIGDTDQNDDSGLFIAASNAGLPQLSINFATGIDYLVEGCVNIPSIVNVSLPQALVAPATFNVEVGGSATLGTDYTLGVGTTFTIPSGQTSFGFPIQPIVDALAEGTETIVLTLKRNYGCGEIAIATLTIELEDALQVSILPDDPTIFVCQGINTAELSAMGAASYAWTPVSIFDNPASANPTATISSNTVVTVTGTLGTCTATDQATLQLIAPQIDILANGGTQICQGESVQLTAQNNVNSAGLSWSPASGLNDPAAQIVTATPAATTTYTATVSATGGCTASDQITVNVEPFAFPQTVSDDVTICQNSSVQLASVVTGTSTAFAWTPATGLNNANIAGAIATPDVTTTYTLNATSPNGLCTESESVTVTVLPADVDISPDTLEICLGSSVPISANTTTSGAGFTWSPTDSLIVTGAETAAVNPSQSTWYVGTLVVGQCTVKDSVLVRVDSLPNLAIFAIPEKESYCVGEVITLVSPTYPFLNFIDIEHQWAPLTGAQTADSLFNLVITATETTTYVRTSTNHACSDTAQITIVVTPVAVITVTPENPSVCAGQSVQLTASSPDISEFEWSPSVGLSCTDCPNPAATPPATLTYQVQGEFNGCPAYETVTVVVSPAPTWQFPANPIICIGESIVLNENVDADATYSWAANGQVISTEALPEVSPTTTTTYELTISQSGCTPITAEVTVTVIPDYELVLNNTDVSICKGNTLLLSATAQGVNGGVYIWSPNGGGNNQEITVTENTTYTVNYTDPAGCFTKTASFDVEAIDPFLPDGNLTADPDTAYEGQLINLQITTSPAVLDGGVYTWLLDGIQFSETTTPSLETLAPNTGMFDSVFYKVTIADEYGCMLMDTVKVFVLKSAFDMPNVFSPNNDELNNTFKPVTSPDVEILDFRVWSRWGKLVYENENGAEGWDGNFKKEPMPSDVYVFYMRYVQAGTERVLKGDVTLVR